MNVKNFQQKLGVVADGVLGPATFLAMFVKAGASFFIAQELALGANVRLQQFGLLDNPLRLAHFLAQTGEETGNFYYMSEIWGPTEAQRGYEGRLDLGNIVTGDGFRYRGRGLIQVTGRGNYHRVGSRIGIDIEHHPEIVEFPSIGLLVALQYWQDHQLNDLADADDVVGITHKVNGGENGLEVRKQLLARAKGWLL